MKMAKKWKPWVSGSKCWHDFLVNKFVYMTKIWADMSYLGGRLAPLVEVYLYYICLKFMGN